MKIETGFPSPSGDSFSKRYGWIPSWSAWTSFRPLPEIHFLNLMEGYYTVKEFSFPSPSRDSFSKLLKKRGNPPFIQFPSPSGDSFSKLSRNCWIKHKGRGFRPLPEIHFLNINEKTLQKCLTNSFRPLPEIHFLN